jgi:hypothetical protein
MIDNNVMRRLLSERLRPLIERYNRYSECDEYHIHNDPDDGKDHEVFPLSEHDTFDEDELLNAILEFLVPQETWTDRLSEEDRRNLSKSGLDMR